MRATLLVLVGLAACGGKESTPAATPAEPAASASPPPSASAAAEPEEPARRSRPLEVHSACSEVVTVVFAEDPKAADVGKRTVAPSSSIDAPRDKNGNQTVWLLDSSGQPLVNVRVTRGMKRVEVGRSCRTLDAR